MKIYLAQQNYHIGNFDANTEKIIEGINKAKAEGADLVLFSELCICGYPPRDFLEFDDFINQCYEAIGKVKVHADTIGVLIGGPARNPRKEGKELFNAAFFLYEGEVKAEIHKTLLPTYDVFDENRYFEPAFSWKCIEFKGRKLAVTICEDIWNLGDNPLYRLTPMEVLIKESPDVMLNLSASPYNYAQDTVRNSIVKAHTEKYRIPMLYCNNVGSQTEIVFDGGSLVYDAAGNKVKELAYFEEDYFLYEAPLPTRSETAPSVSRGEPGTAQAQPKQEATIAVETSLRENNTAEQILQAELPGDKKASTESGALQPGRSGQEGRTYYYSAADVGKGSDIIAYLTDDKNIGEIHRALLLGIRDYFFKMGFKKATLGA
ncbi:MAG TPA: nitrilase-related carbon-nitrogen hydrolase, partial [Flavisolibacter sp.]